MKGVKLVESGAVVLRAPIPTMDVHNYPVEDTEREYK